ncbi:MAG: CIA30 family protein [Chitinophagales bacterium]
MIKSQMIFDFKKDVDVTQWKVVDDTVMGGVSNGSFKLNSEGHGVFEGHVSLENNGGFSSVRYSFNNINLEGRQTIVLKVKGDGKKYQFRIKDDSNTYYSYITYFETTGDWQTIEIPLKDFYPSFRGRKLNRPNFNSDSIEEIAFLIGNKKNEDFKLMIDSIALK